MTVDFNSGQETTTADVNSVAAFTTVNGGCNCRCTAEVVSSSSREDVVDERAAEEDVVIALTCSDVGSSQALQLRAEDDRIVTFLAACNELGSCCCHRLGDDSGDDGSCSSGSTAERFGVEGRDAEADATGVVTGWFGMVPVAIAVRPKAAKSMTSLPEPPLMV